MRLSPSIKASLYRTLYMAPSAICIGAQKAGTTALYKYLKLHPQVLTTEVKELDFFNCGARYADGLGAYYRNFPKKGLRNIGKITVDITPGYMNGAIRAASRIAAFRASMSLIALLRNPVDRAFSAWQMYRRLHGSNRNWFSEWVTRCDGAQAIDEFQQRSEQFGQDFAHDIREEMNANESGIRIEMPILALGEYARHLAYYYKHFDRAQILVVWSEDFREHTLDTLRRIESFLKLKPNRWNSADLTPQFAGEYEYGDFPRDARELLGDYYETRNKALFELVNGQTNWP